MVVMQAPAAPTGTHRPGTDDGPLRFARRRGRRRIAGVGVTQLVLLELAGTAPVLAAGRGPAALITAGCVALLLLLIAFGRGGRRWWAEWLLLRWRYGRRRSANPAPTDADARLAALGRLAPALSVCTFADRGTHLGIGQDEAGWFAAVAVSPRSGLRGDPVEALPVETLGRMLTDAGPRVSAVQLVLHTIPAPATLLSDTAPVARSYRALASGDLGVQPLEQRCWLAVRLDPAAAAEAAATRGGGLDGVHRALATSVGRLGKAVNGAGLAYRILDAEDLLDALSQSCGVGGYVDPAATRRIREHWRGWRAGGLEQACFWVSQWPRLRDVGGVMARLARTPAVLTSVSLTLEAHGDDTDLRCVVRLGSVPGQLADSSRALRGIARASRAGLFRLDGEQAPAVYASAPSGGGAR